MQAFVKAANWIDRVTEMFARIARWALLADSLLIAGNAISRKVFSVAAPALFDLQWQFFAAVVLLTAAFALQRDEHVRIDILAERLGPRRMAFVDAVGFLAVLLPICLAMIWLTVPQFLTSFLAGETRATRESVSQLPAWIIKGLIPLGFSLLALQAIAEAIRRVEIIRGGAPVSKRRTLFGEPRVP